MFCSFADKLSIAIRVGVIISQLRTQSMRSPLRDFGVIEVSTYPSSGHLRSGEIVLRCSDIPGQQLLDAVDRVIGDLFEHTAKVQLRIEPV